MLTYEAGPGSKQLLKPTAFGDADAATLLYDPPIDEFSVLRVELEQSQSTEHRSVAGPSMVIVTEGEGTVSWQGQAAGEESFKRGDVLFISAGQPIKWTASGKVELYRAFVEAQ